MAYSTVYDMTWRSNEASGSIELQTDGGAYDRGLYLIRDSLQIRTEISSWDDPIVRKNCSFSIVNTLDDYFDIIPLITMSADKWKVVVKETSPDSAEHTLFEGFLNVETISASIHDYAEVTFTASGYLSKLENIIPSSINTIRIRSLIDIIADCLAETGVVYDIRVNCTLYESQSELGSGQTLFNRVGAFHEAFWESDTERMSALEILTTILKPFCCYLYWHDGYWYIDRYSNLLGTSGSVQGDNHYISRSYVEYDGAGGYDYGDSGSVETVVVQDYSIHSLHQANTSQLLTITPGVKQININVAKKTFTNAINPDLRYFTYYSETQPDPDLRQWEVYRWEPGTPAWTDQGKPHKSIRNSVCLTMANCNQFGHPVTNNHDQRYNGMVTKFQIYSNEGTDLSIGWKFRIPSNSGDTTYYLPSGLTPNTAADWTIRLYYQLRHYRNGNWWYIESDGNGGVTENLLGDATYQYIDVSAAEIIKDWNWSSPQNNYYEARISVPIGDLYSSSNIELVFTWGIPAWYHVDTPSDLYVATKLYVGDFSIVASESETGTVVTGGYSSNFYDELDYSLELFDSYNWNFRNALRWGTNWEDYTNFWDDESYLWHDSAEGGVWSDVNRVLYNLFLEQKFRIYHLARQSQKYEYITRSLFRPLQPFFDTKQSDKRFMLGSDIFFPEEDRHEVQLWEYDNTTAITLTPDSGFVDEARSRGGVRRIYPRRTEPRPSRRGGVSSKHGARDIGR